MRWQLQMGLGIGGVVLLPLACSWGAEFHACEADPCGTGGTTSTSGLAGGGGSTAGSSTATTGAGGAAGSPTGGGEAGESGVAGAAGAGGSPPTCDGELLPGDDACVVDEEFGVFVSPSGDDATGKGTRKSPFASLQQGADAASESGKRVYACATAGDYVDGLSLSEEHDELELYGSFDCSDWSYGATLQATVAPEAGVVLTVSEIATSLALDGFAFESADATEPGASSIAAMVRTSSGVVLRHVALRAGAGATGTRGASGRFTHPNESEFDGVDGTSASGGVTSFVSCPGGDETRGGVGGHPDLTESRDGLDGLPDHEGAGGEGGVEGESCVGQAGRDGPNGADGAGATRSGALTNGTWVPANATDGRAGLPGQGGGGGAGTSGGGGGSGGAGGCGLAGGKGGGGGGASIALAVLDAEVALFDSEVTAGDAGDGGSGGAAEERVQAFGSPGEGYGSGCDGGRGGAGGRGGGGGGGAGGVSAGVAYQGIEPERTNTTVTVGTKGEPGPGGGTNNDGVDGQSVPSIRISAL